MSAIETPPRDGARDHPAYTLGRLLAALEHLDQIRTDPDRLAGQAALSPLHLVHWLNEATARGGARVRDYITPLMASLPADRNVFAAHLTPEEEGWFFLGFYHQRKASRDGVAPTFDDDLTVAQAADLLGITRQTVHQAIEAGRLPARKAGERATLIRRVDVERYAATRKPRPQRAD